MKPTREVIQFIREQPRFLILGHKEPDGDCIASQIVFAGLLEKLGKSFTLVSAGPFDRPEIAVYESHFARDISESDLRSKPAVAVVDCSTPDRTGKPGERVDGLPCLVVDHHSSGETFGSVRFVVPSAPSTTMLVLSLFDELGISPTAEQAQLILFGLCTDTGFFRHLGTNAGETFRSVARLVEMGTSTAEIFQSMYGGRELSSRKLLAMMLERTESWWNDRFLITWQTRAEREGLGVKARGEDDLYRLLQTVKGNQVVAFIKEEPDGRFSVGLRSNHDVDVGAVAASFGGGGHRQAAGCDMPGPIDAIKRTLLRTFEAILNK